MDLFDQYFRQADLDRDGRISGAEAVGFFQGSNLPKNVLAQIWMHADQNRIGFLGRQEFYNALKLVTVAQSGRELTPDIVKAALLGPAAAKIPAPRINSVPVPGPQMSSVVAPTPRMGIVPPTSQNLGFRGPQVFPSVGMNPQVLPSLNNQFIRPQTTPPTASSITSVTAPGLAPRPRSPLAPTTSVMSKPLDPASFQSNDSKALVLSGNGYTSDSGFGGETYSSNQAKPSSFTSNLSASGVQNVANTSSIAVGSQSSVKQANADPFQSFVTLPSGGSQPPQPQVPQNPQAGLPTTSASSAPHVLVGAVGPASSQAQVQWPKITQPDIKKYTKVFVEVDKDRDGKITGEEARNLFLSWRLPREVLKQVWDLSDEDNDSMLSLREFCVALYLMERYREGRPIPSVLPNSLRFDETLLQAAGQPSSAYGAPSWQTNPGLSHQGIPQPRPLMASGVRPPMQNSVVSLTEGALQPSQIMSRGSIHDRNLQNHQVRDEQDAPEPTFEDNKVEESKKILDSREKLEFYRTKMQELVLYKSRCDNRLNEISERASADKREVESLGKKYEEKYKQVADIASKLTVEEANFRHVQERKVELQTAIVKIEQGGSVDGLLQVRADRIQSDLDELAKALTERSKKHGIEVNTIASVELPFGWQPGIQEGAVDWDEEWDKFEDEGFSVAKEHSVGVDSSPPPAENSPPTWGDEIFADEEYPVESSPRIFSNGAEHITENGSEHVRSEDGSARSPHGSPGRIAFDSPPQEFHSPSHDVSPQAKYNYSDPFGAESTISEDKFGDDTWGANFDTNDDVDSVWGFNAKDSFFDSGDFGLNPIKVDSPGSSSEFGKEKKSSFFADSVPSSPLFNSSSPPSFNERPDRYSFDASSRFDSFSTRDSGLFQQRDSLARFDSMRSTSEFGGGTRGFSFDDNDPFGSTGPFKSSESHSPKKGSSDDWSSF